MAWLSDELEAADSDRQDPSGRRDVGAEVERILLRKHRLGMALASIRIVAVVIVGQRSLELAIQLAGVGYLLLALTTMLLMTEKGFDGGREHGKTFTSILREGSQVIKSPRRLRRIMLVAAGLSFAGDALDYLGLKRFLDTTGTVDSSIVPMGAWFLAAVAAVYVVNVVVTRQIGRFADLSRIAAIMFLLEAVGVGMAALSNLWVVIAIGLIVQDSLRETFYPVLEGWVNRDTPSDVRATVHSMVSQASSVTEVIGGLVWGARSAVLFCSDRIVRNRICGSWCGLVS